VREVFETERRVTGRRIDARTVLVGRLGRGGHRPTLGRNLLGWSAERSELAAVVADTWRWHRQGFGQPTQRAAAAAAVSKA
jgi:hypothetical protein